MINRDDIEAGDKVYTRDGGCLVARETKDKRLSIGGHYPSFWELDGSFYAEETHPLDIIRIEKAPKPAVEVNWLMWDDEFEDAYLDIEDNLYAYKHAIKLTIINGKLEKSEQVK